MSSTKWLLSLQFSPWWSFLGRGVLAGNGRKVLWESGVCLPEQSRTWGRGSSSDSESVTHITWLLLQCSVAAVMSDSMQLPWTVHQAPLSIGILQARILEWVAIPSSRGSSRPRDWTWVSSVSIFGRWVLYCPLDPPHRAPALWLS